jgi:propionyl-CoA synthetase
VLRQGYVKEYERSLADPEGFWREQSEGLSWYKAPKRILDREGASPASLWFPDGELNVSFNALDRHIQEGRGDSSALVFESAYNNSKRVLSYSELLDQVSRLSCTSTFLL